MGITITYSTDITAWRNAPRQAYQYRVALEFPADTDPDDAAAAWLAMRDWLDVYMNLIDLEQSFDFTPTPVAVCQYLARVVPVVAPAAAVLHLDVQTVGESDRLTMYVDVRE